MNTGSYVQLEPGSTEEQKAIDELIVLLKQSHAIVVMWRNEDGSGGYQVLGCLGHAYQTVREQGSALLSAIRAGHDAENNPQDPTKLN